MLEGREIDAWIRDEHNKKQETFVHSRSIFPTFPTEQRENFHQSGFIQLDTEFSIFEIEEINPMPSYVVGKINVNFRHIMLITFVVFEGTQYLKVLTIHRGYCEFLFGVILLQ